MRCQFRKRGCTGTATVNAIDTGTGREYVVCRPCMARALVDQQPLADRPALPRHPGVR